MSYYNFYGKCDKSIQTIFAPNNVQGVITNFNIESILADTTAYEHKIYLKHINNTREVLMITPTLYSEGRKYLDNLKGFVIPNGSKLEIEGDWADQMPLNLPQNINFTCSVYVDDGDPTNGGEVIVPYLIGQNSVLGDSCATGTRLITFDYYGGLATINVDTTLWTTNKDNVDMAVIRWTNSGRTTSETISTVPQVAGGSFSLNITNLQPFYGISLRGQANGVTSDLCCSWNQKTRTIAVNDGQISSVVS